MINISGIKKTHKWPEFKFYGRAGLCTPDVLSAEAIKISLQLMKEQACNGSGRDEALMSSVNAAFGGLPAELFSHNIIYLPVVKSTNDVAREMAAQGCPEGTVIVAGCQTGGKGRMGRLWDSPEGKGVYISVVLRPENLNEDMPLINLMAAVAAVETVNTVLDADVAGIKWPNDIVIKTGSGPDKEQVSEAGEEAGEEAGVIMPLREVSVQKKGHAGFGAKICGILAEMACEANKINYLVIGAGINVYQSEADFKGDLEGSASSMILAAAAVTGDGAIAKTVEANESLKAGSSSGGGGSLNKDRLFNRADIAAILLINLGKWYNILMSGHEGKEEVVSMWRRRSVMPGRTVLYGERTPGKMRTGFVKDIDGYGRLIVRNIDGTIDYLTAGEISIVGI
ncbi:MAG: biotin--[acetyl-CoA-carboxylase] ligase [Eubacteriales bacterium]|nr:biotin--[acetyl-CoA-carboxylase] ligase [Eubacteriales bacterium]